MTTETRAAEVVDAEQVARVRSFNRVVTQRVGVLHDEYLSRGRPLGASRLLWELADDGSDLRDLRTRLDLDAGYCSRLVRMLEDEGLVAVVPDPADRRRRVLTPTAAGRAEREVLDTGSDDLARDLLTPLDPTQRERLAAAMASVERLLTSSLVSTAVEDAGSEDARWCLASYYADLDARFPRGFDVAAALPTTPEQLTPPDGLLLVARLRGRPVGCGALKFHGEDPAELKRLWVAPDARGLGLGRRLLAELEERARAAGVARLLLDTNAALVEAVALYRATGWAEVEAFNDEPHADHWFAKELGPTP